MRPIRLFVSTTKDLSAERASLAAGIQQLNDTYPGKHQIFTYAYEDGKCVNGGTLHTPQANRYILLPESSDVFLGMLWLNIGVPNAVRVNPETGKPYQSSVEYELMTAYRGMQQRGIPRIILYRCIRSTPDLKKLDPAQYLLVQKLFDRFAAEKSITIHEFISTEELQGLVFKDLETLFPESPAFTVEPEEYEAPKPIYVLPEKLPAAFIERPEVAHEIESALLSSYWKISVVDSEPRDLGQGKTVMARAIADADSVRHLCPHGVLWATFGANSDPLRLQRGWISALDGDVGEAYSIESGRAELKRLLYDRRMLLILDNVRGPADLAALDVGVPQCLVLITTKDKSCVTDTLQVTLAEMSPDDAQKLLAKVAKKRISREAFLQIVKYVGVSPFVLNIVGRLLATGAQWSDLLPDIQKAQKHFADRPLGKALAAIKVSADGLSETERARYTELVIFPPNEPLTDELVSKLWSKTANLDAKAVAALLNKFREAMLIQGDNTLHELHREYLLDALRTKAAPAAHTVSTTATHDVSDPASLARTEKTDETPKDEANSDESKSDETAAAPGASTMPAIPAAGSANGESAYHRAFVDAYGSLFPQDNYGWRQLIFHLAKAGRTDEVRQLLTDVSYLQKKIEQLGTSAVLSDYALLGEDGFRQLTGALRRSAAILDRRPDELINQLYGRLGTLQDLRLPAVNGTAPRFRLESRTLISPDWPLLETLNGHTAWITDCTFSADGQYALTASADKTLRLWDVRAGKSLRTFRGHAKAVNTCALSHDGQFALSGSRDETLQVWSVANAKMLRTLGGHSDSINGCAISADGRLALSASSDRTVRLWDVHRGEQIKVFEGHKGPVQSCALNVERHIALSASDDQTLRIWNIDTGEEIAVLEGHEAAIMGCVLSADGRLALSASADMTARFWDIDLGEKLLTLEGHSHWVLSCAMSPGNNHALTASLDSTVRLWDMQTGQSLTILHGESGMTSCDFSPDARYALSASAKSLQFWDIATSQKNQYRALTPESRCLISPNGKITINIVNENILELWDADDKDILRILKGHAGLITSCSFNASSDLLLTGSSDKTLRIWHVENGTTICEMRGHSDAVTDCTFSPDGKFILSASQDKTLRLWSVATGSEVCRWTADSALLSCAFYANGINVIARDLLDNVHFLRLEGIGDKA